MSTIRVMISSRCYDRFPLDDPEAASLSDIRLQLKQDLENVRIFDRQVYSVWINEAAPPQGGNWDSWDVCMNAVRDCDILIVISNGNSGWAGNGGEIGICHGEMLTGLTVAPSKVRLVELGRIPITDDEHGERNQRFQEYLARQNRFRGGNVQNVAQLYDRVREALHDATILLMQAGALAATHLEPHMGTALEWTRLAFRERQQKMVDVMCASAEARVGAQRVENRLSLPVDGTNVVFVMHAIPDALTIGSAIELVGQPFLSDHSLAHFIPEGQGGPVHLIACHKGATTSQARKLLGFSDATVVSAPFGVYVADNVQKVQFVFITKCQDEGTSRIGLQRFFDWLTQSGEDEMLAMRALSRARIVRAIAAEAQ